MIFIVVMMTRIISIVLISFAAAIRPITGTSPSPLIITSGGYAHLMNERSAILLIMKVLLEKQQLRLQIIKRSTPKKHRKSSDKRIIFLQ